MKNLGKNCKNKNTQHKHFLSKMFQKPDSLRFICLICMSPYFNMWNGVKRKHSLLSSLFLLKSSLTDFPSPALHSLVSLFHPKAEFSMSFITTNTILSPPPSAPGAHTNYSKFMKDYFFCCPFFIFLHLNMLTGNFKSNPIWVGPASNL